jgi:hypothetical protein
MTDVGTTHEDLERFLGEHHLVGAGLKRDKRAAVREGKTAAHWKWDGIHRGLKRSGEIVTVGPNGMTGMRSVVGIEAKKFPIWMNAQILMPGERTQAHRNLRSETRLVCEAPKDALFVCEYEAYPMERGDVVISPAWTFHDHWNKDTTPAIWIDGYDNGYNPNVNINERMPNDEPYEEIKKPAGYGQRTLGLARPMVNQAPFPLPPMRYPWADTAADALSVGGYVRGVDGAQRKWRRRSLRRHVDHPRQPGRRRPDFADDRLASAVASRETKNHGAPPQQHDLLLRLRRFGCGRHRRRTVGIRQRRHLRRAGVDVASS